MVELEKEKKILRGDNLSLPFILKCTYNCAIASSQQSQTCQHEYNSIDITNNQQV